VSKKQKPEEAIGVVPELTTWLWGGPPSECMEAIELYPIEEFKLERVALLNAFVIPRKAMVIVTMPTNIENVKLIVQKAKSLESYIGHEATAKLLSEILSINFQVNRGEYVPEVGDIAIVVRLKRRLQTPQDLKDIKLEDLEFHIINYNNSWVPGYG
jgi:hypothetical protein